MQYVKYLYSTNRERLKQESNSPILLLERAIKDCRSLNALLSQSGCWLSESKAPILRRYL